MIIINNGTISNNNSINISGNISGSNITISANNNINGNVSAKRRNFDKKEAIDASSVEKIDIASDVAVNISASNSNSSKITVHFHGQAGIAEEDIWLYHCIVEHELRIQLKFIDACFDSNLKLDIKVPYKTFKAIFANITSADFNLDEGVSMESLRVRTTAGNVKLNIYALKDIEVGISTTSGSVSAVLNNINFAYLSTRSTSGTIRNYHKSGNGYMANVDIATRSGNITLY